MRAVVFAAFMLLGVVSSAESADKFKIGFMTTMSGPAAVLGTHLRDGVLMAIEHLNGKIGNSEIQLLIEDDQGKPDVARQIADKFVKSERVDAVVGIQNSAVMLAVAGPLSQSKTIFIGATAGPSQLAGKDCTEYFFSASWQGDNFAEAMGAYLQTKGVQDVYLLAPNYAAGRDIITGFKRFYKNKVAGEVFTPLSQLDFSSEIAQIRAANPAAVFAFYPGGLGIQFAKQYSQSGMKERIPLYSSFIVDYTTIPAIGADAIGMVATTEWNDDMDNPQNKRFVADFKKKFNYVPSTYSAQAYDAVMLLESGVRGVGGHVQDKTKLIAELKKANFKSVRGAFKFNTNHFPIQDFYLVTVEKGDTGPKLKLGQRILASHSDAYAGSCPMK